MISQVNVRRRAAGRARIIAAAALALASLTAAIAPSAGAPEPGLPILVYHQIRTGSNDPADGPTAMSLARFESQMQYLHERNYVTLTTDQVVDLVVRGKAPGTKIVAINFDDGWKSALAALPVLDRFGFHATFWIIPGTGIGWPHMDWEEVRMLAEHPGIEVYSHTMTHPWKDGETLVDWIAGGTPSSIDQARWELAESRRLLEEKLGRKVPYLAWPRGVYNDTLIGLAREAGYRALFTIDDGINRRGQDPLRIRRTLVHGGCNMKAFAAILADGRYRECGDDTGSMRSVSARH